MRPAAVWLVVAAIALVAASAATVYWYQGQLPDRVAACGRTYGHTTGSVGAGPFDLANLRQVEPDVARVKELPRGRELWASPRCGLGVFVRVGDDKFLGYGLLGGP